MSEITPASETTPPNSSSAREAEKTDLEIQSLRKKAKRDWIRTATLLVAALGLLFGVYQFIIAQQTETALREAEEKLRFQSQLRSDVDEILRFPKEKTVSRIAFLLEDLSTTLNSKASNGHVVSEMFPDYRRSFTKQLVYLISYDSDFIWGRKETELADIALSQWNDYGTFLKEDLVKLNAILYNHVRALRYLRDHNPGYFQNMTYESETDSYVVSPSYEQQDSEEERYQHFLDIRDSFLDHLKLIADDQRPDAKEIRERSRREFEGALCNPRVSEQVFGKDFSNQPCDE